VCRVIGYVLQMCSADGALTDYENLLIFAKPYDPPRAALVLGKALSAGGRGLSQAVIIYILVLIGARLYPNVVI
jgi:hypothetical protein